MIYNHDPELEKELKEKLFNYKEVYLMIEHVHKKSRRNKYWAILLAGIWTPVITIGFLIQYQHPLVYLVGAFSTTFAIYVWDETYETAHNAIARKLKKNDRNKED